MAAGAFIPVAIFVLVVGTVGCRLLGLWRRTRQTPELLLGLGLVLMSCVAIPLTGIGRLPGVTDTSFGKACFALGLATIAIATTLLIGFTQRVFRAGVLWARGLAIGVSLVVAVAVTWMSQANFVGANLSEIVELMRPGTLTLMGSLLVCFAWASAESFFYHANLERRLVLGLADPVLVNRFLLWGISSAANTVLMAVILYCVQSGMVIMHESIPLTAIAIIGSVMSAAWTLTFLAPDSYLTYIRNRATRS
jgi:hypothetical protein